MAMAALPAPFSTGGGARTRPAPAADGPAPPPPEHVVIDIPATAVARPVVVVVVPEGAPTPPSEPEHAAPDIPAAATITPPVAGPKKPTRFGAFVRKLVKVLCAAYTLLIAPGLVAAALVLGPSPFVQLMVIFACVLTVALFLVRQAEEKEAQAQTEVKP